MTDKNSRYIVVAKIGTTYGILGWLKIQAYTEFRASILDYSPWYLSESEDNYSEIKVEDGKKHGKSMIAKLAGFDNPEQARLLTGKKIYIQRSQLATLDNEEYYWADLEGLTVINQNGETLGKVTHLMETGANDVLVIKGDKEHAIPYLLGTVVLNVDLEKQQIIVDWELI